MNTARPPVALTIAGSDSCGGAGIQLDLKVFSSLVVFGASVVTAITAQNSQGVHKTQNVPSAMVAEQLTAVIDDLPIAAAKCGMLASAQTVRAVARCLANTAKPIPLVIDPVIAAKNQTALLSQAGINVLRKHLLPMATLITPNLDEAAQLCEMKVATPAQARKAAECLVTMGAQAALVKGGHLKGEAIDIFFDGQEFIEFHAQSRARGVIHGTGCALSAAITAYLAQGQKLPDALRNAHTYTQQLIHQACQIGKGYSFLIPEQIS
jgi:hydroxymethylpyrimidine/phosphomethylpyrimidine kinase